MNRALLLFLFLVSITVQSQKTVNGLEASVTKAREMMHEKQITDYVILTKSRYANVTTYYEDSEGKREKEETYLTNMFEAYLFWKENSKCYLQLTDMNFTYQPLLLDQCGFLKLDAKTIDQISKEEVLPIVILENGAKTYLDIPNHFQSQFYFSNGNSKEFPAFYLSEPEKRNSNNTKNSKLQITKLYKTCEKIIRNNSDLLHRNKQKN